MSLSRAVTLPEAEAQQPVGVEGRDVRPVRSRRLGQQQDPPEAEAQQPVGVEGRDVRPVRSRRLGQQQDPPEAEAQPSPEPAGFEVHLENFSGPFDLLLSLIAKHELDVTELALAAVTDEFVAHIRAAEAGAREAADRGEEQLSWDLGTASEFLVVAATLLDLKAARLLPGIVEEDADDLELLEARDLLFARLLQYRAYKEVSGLLAERLATEGRRVPRAVPLEPHLTALLPELVWTLDGARLADLAARALAPRLPPVVGLEHLHAPAVSVREQATVVARRLRRDRVATFRALVAGEERIVAVARFLALLELFRSGQVAFEQAAALAELTVRWTGDGWSEGEGAVDDVLVAGFEEFDGAPLEAVQEGMS